MKTQRITLTYELVMAMSRDAGNASMRKHGRKKWNRSDWNAACEVSDRFLPYILEQPEIRAAA